MKIIFFLAVTVVTIGLTQPVLSQSNPDSGVVILRCSVEGTAYEVTAASESSNVRDVDIGASCARELERYLRANFTFKSTVGAQSGSIVTYTLVGP